MNTNAIRLGMSSKGKVNSRDDATAANQDTSLFPEMKLLGILWADIGTAYLLG